MDGKPLSRVMFLAAWLVVAPGASPSSCPNVSSSDRYFSIVELQGPKIEGLEWIRFYDLLDYEGEGRILVSGRRGFGRFPIVKWENGLECTYDEAGAETCRPNEQFQGVNLSRYFGSGRIVSDNTNQLRKGVLRLIVESDGGEVKMTLRSLIVRNTPGLNGEYADFMCVLIENAR